MVFLLNGAIQSGKTTALGQFCRRPGCDGLLSPVIDGRRSFQRIRTGETISMETAGPGLKIGRFRFDPAAFAWANRQIEEAVSAFPDWLIIDEIGPLELSGGGLQPAMNLALSRLAENKNLILVVRLGLEEAVTACLGSHSFRIIQSRELDFL